MASKFGGREPTPGEYILGILSQGVGGYVEGRKYKLEREDELARQKAKNEIDKMLFKLREENLKLAQKREKRLGQPEIAPDMYEIPSDVVSFYNLPFNQGTQDQVTKLATMYKDDMRLRDAQMRLSQRGGGGATNRQQLDLDRITDNIRMYRQGNKDALLESLGITADTSDAGIEALLKEQIRIYERQYGYKEGEMMEQVFPEGVETTNIRGEKKVIEY